MPIAIGFGGNLGGDATILQRFVAAREALAALGAVRSSALYRAAPIGPAQPDYLNAAVSLAIVDVQPAELIASVLELELLAGRDRRGEVHWGPRAIDLDVLVWDERIVDEPGLRVPHPRVHERRFALLPLIDLYGEDRVIVGPGAGRTLRVLAAAVASQRVERVRDRW